MNLIKYLCEKFVERSNALNLKGIKREDAAMSFFYGAANALPDGSEEQKRVVYFIQFIIQFRGYKGIEMELEKVVDKEQKVG